MGAKQRTSLYAEIAGPLRSSRTTLEKDKQTDMDAPVTAPELMLDGIFQHNNGAVN